MAARQEQAEARTLSQELEGRRVLVTGGSRGIGAAVAQRLLDAGARVVVTARARHAETPPGARFVAGDLRTEAGAKAVGERALGELGGLDILVNNAGGTRVHLPNSEGIGDAEWVEALDLNFLSAVRLTSRHEASGSPATTTTWMAGRGACEETTRGRVQAGIATSPSGTRLQA